MLTCYRDWRASVAASWLQCIAFNDRCILLDPNLAEAHANLANALQQMGNMDMAIVYYQSALRLKPYFTDAYNNMASALVQKGLIPEAMDCYMQVTWGDILRNVLRVLQLLVVFCCCTWSDVMLLCVTCCFLGTLCCQGVFLSQGFFQVQLLMCVDSCCADLCLLSCIRLCG